MRIRIAVAIGGGAPFVYIMCGICGIIEKEGIAAEQNLIDKMTDIMTHRGPDDRGVFVEKNVALGARRLSIIGLSNGHQPIHNEDKTIWLVANGEIFNYKTIKERLLAAGHKFLTDTDTEVILHLYEEKGEACAKELNGMYGVAIWDAKKNKLVLFRDHAGIKPLFYTINHNRFLFGSEIKSILEDDLFIRRVDKQAMYDFFSLDYVPGEQTAFENIKEVLPGHYLIFEHGKIRQEKYWDLSYQNQIIYPHYQDYCEQVVDLMKKAIDRWSMSEVPLGVFLSGGMDSSAIVALMTEMGYKNINTYSVGFQEQSYSELQYARIISQKFNTNHHEVIVDAKDALDVLEKTVWNIDEPYADGSVVPVYRISELAKKQITVVHSGEGGDEIFAGYVTYRAYLVGQLYKIIPALVRNKVVAPIVKALPVSDKKLSFDFKAKKFIDYVAKNTPEAHMLTRAVLSDTEKQKLFSDDFIGSLKTERFFNEFFNNCDAKEIINKLLYLDTKIFLPDDLFVKSDRMTMAHSLEARVPFMDRDLMEYMARVPVRIKMKYGIEKYLMRKSLLKHLPAKICFKKKLGLEMPYGIWLKGELKEYLLSYINEEKINSVGLFDYTYIKKMLDEHLQNRRDNSRFLWGLLNFMIWHKIYFK